MDEIAAFSQDTHAWEQILARDTWAAIIRYLALSPGSQDNGIASASRHMNVRWRSYQTEFRNMMDGMSNKWKLHIKEELDDAKDNLRMQIAVTAHLDDIPYRRMISIDEVPIYILPRSVQNAFTVVLGVPAVHGPLFAQVIFRGTTTSLVTDCNRLTFIQGPPIGT